MRISVPRSVGGRHESQVRPHRAALLEAVGILQGKHEGQRCKRPNPLDLSQELRFGIMCFRDLLQFALVVADTLCERADLLEDGPKSRPKRLRYVLCSSLVEAHRWALGQAGSEGFDRSAHVVYELRAATDQCLTRADDGHVSLGIFAPMLERIEQLRIKTCQSSQILSVYLVGLAPALA